MRSLSISVQVRMFRGNSATKYSTVLNIATAEVFPCVTPFKIRFFDGALVLGRKIRNDPWAIGRNNRVRTLCRSICGISSLAPYIAIIVSSVSNKSQESYPSGKQLGTLVEAQPTELSANVRTEPFYLSLYIIFGIVVCWLGISGIWLALACNMLTRKLTTMPRRSWSRSELS